MPIRPFHKWAGKQGRQGGRLPSLVPAYIRVPKGFRTMLNHAPAFISKGDAAVGPDMIKWAQFDMKMKQAMKQDAYSTAFSLQKLLKKHPRLTKIRYMAKAGTLVHVDRSGHMIDPNAPPPATATHEFPWRRWAADSETILRANQMTLKYLKKASRGMGTHIRDQLADYFARRNEEERRKLELPWGEDQSGPSVAERWGVGDTDRNIAADALRDVLRRLDGDATDALRRNRTLAGYQDDADDKTIFGTLQRRDVAGRRWLSSRDRGGRPMTAEQMDAAASARVDARNRDVERARRADAEHRGVDYDSLLMGTNGSIRGAAEALDLAVSEDIEGTTTESAAYAVDPSSPAALLSRRRGAPRYDIGEVADEAATLDSLAAAEAYARLVVDDSRLWGESADPQPEAGARTTSAFAPSYQSTGAFDDVDPLAASAVGAAGGAADGSPADGTASARAAVRMDSGDDLDDGAMPTLDAPIPGGGRLHQGLVPPPTGGLTSPARAQTLPGSVSSTLADARSDAFPWESLSGATPYAVGAASGHRGASVGGVSGSLRSDLSWDALRIPPAAQAVLREHGMPRPSRCQAMAVPTILDGVDTLICAQTGTGKTLAALLPTVVRLQRDTQFYGLTAQPGSPRAIVLCPSNELVAQTVKWAEMVAAPLGVTVTSVSGRVQAEAVVHSLVNPADILVTTPTLLSRLLWLTRTTPAGAPGPRVDLTRTRYVIVDEADWLMSPGDNAYTQDIIRDVAATCLPDHERVHAGNSVRVREFEDKCAAVLKTKHTAPVVPRVGELLRPIQFTLLCATPNAALRGWFESTLPRGLIVAEPTIFQARSRLKQELIYCRHKEKLSVALNLLGACGHRFFDPSVNRDGIYSSGGGLSTAGRARTDIAAGGQDISSSSLSLWFSKSGGSVRPVGKRVIIFVNSTSRAIKLSLALRDRGIAAEPLHGELSRDIRAETLSRFRDTDVGGVLVATDLASRGLDDFSCDYVIVYDVPYDAATYLHRVGRTARGNEIGFATTLVTSSGAERALMTEIHRAQRDRVSLEGLTQGYARYRISQPSHESKVRRDAIREAGGQIANLKIVSRKAEAQAVTDQMQRQLAFNNTLSVMSQVSSAKQRTAAKSLK